MVSPSVLPASAQCITFSDAITKIHLPPPGDIARAIDVLLDPQLEETDSEQWLHAFDNMSRFQVYVYLCVHKSNANSTAESVKLSISELSVLTEQVRGGLEANASDLLHPPTTSSTSYHTSYDYLEKVYGTLSNVDESCALE